MQEIQTKHRFQVLDIFRGLFAFVVVLFHLQNQTCTLLTRNNFTKNGYLFVDFFFVLSGFVIAYSYGNKLKQFADLKTFMQRRIQRLYPLHLAMLLVYVVYAGARMLGGSGSQTQNVDKYSLSTFFTNIFLVNSIKFPGINNLSWNNPSWSISAECISYITFAIVALIIFKAKLGQVKILVWAIVVAAAIYTAYQLFGTPLKFTTYNNGFLRAITGFCTGVIAYLIFNKIFEAIGSQRNVVLFSILETISVLLIVYFVSSGEFFSKYGLVYELVFFAAILVFSFEGGFVSGLLNKSGFLKTLGKYSYSIYMVHSIVIVGVELTMKKFINKNPLLDTAVVLAALAVVYVVAAWTYKNIEIRFYNTKSKSQIKA